MWTTNITINNNTEYNITVDNLFLPSQIISSSNSIQLVTTDSPNTFSFKFWVLEGTTDFQGGLHFGEDCGVWADRGYMEPPFVIMDVDVNGTSVTQEINGGQTILEDFRAGGDIVITFRYL